MLAAGKGVIIAQDEREARAAVDVFFAEKRFGETEVVLEEFLEGEELSLLALCDGERAVPLAPAQDYKRIFDGDEGPNTGGMGSYSPVPGIDADARRGARRGGPPADRRRAAPARHALPRRALRGPDDDRRRAPKVLEFNCRFGDPETQAVLPRLRSDLLELLEASATPGRPRGRRSPSGSSDWAVTVVLASRGYPESSSKGDEITGLDDGSSDAEVLHAGTAERDGEIVTAGGRVLNVTALGATPGEARERAYAAAERIEFDGKQMRTDIAVARGGWRSGRERNRGARPTAEATTRDGGRARVRRARRGRARRSGIVMGSKSDMPLMEKAGERARGARHPATRSA